MTSFSEMAIPLTLLFVSSAICKSIEIGNEAVLNIEGMNQIDLIKPDNSQKVFNLSNVEQEVNIEANEIQGTAASRYCIIHFKAETIFFWRTGVRQCNGNFVLLLAFQPIKIQVLLKFLALV